MGTPENLPDINLERVCVEVERLIKRLGDDEMRMLDEENHMEVIQMMATEFGYLFEKMPSVFEIVCDEKERFDRQMLLMMLRHYECIKKGTMNMDLANKQIATLGHNKYIQPIMNLPGMKEKIEEYKNELKEKQDRKEQKEIFELMKRGVYDE